MRCTGAPLKVNTCVACSTAPAVDDGRGNPIENDQPFVAVLHLRARDDEDRRAKFRHVHFPFPPQADRFLRPGTPC